MTTQSQLEKLIQQKMQLDERIKLAKTKSNMKVRKQETRRKILVGAAILAAIEAGRVKKDSIIKLVDEFVTRDKDREFFGLEKRDGQEVVEANTASPSGA